MTKSGRPKCQNGFVTLAWGVDLILKRGPKAGSLKKWAGETSTRVNISETVTPHFKRVPRSST